jgi:penicillin-binding protein 1A
MMRFLKGCLLAVLVLLILGGSVGAAFWYLWSSNLPYIGSLADYRPPVVSEIYSSDGEVIARLWDEKRIVVPMDEVPRHLIQAFVAAEDARFFEHPGVDFMGMFRALLNNLLAGKIEQGGSTITQQVTKTLLLKNTERTYKRKAREAILSMQIERSFSKEKILFLYLNQIYLGHGAYGVEAASRTYFNKSTRDLNLQEAALLAGLPQAPSRYSPVSHLDRAKVRQKYVLDRMLEEGYISKEAHDEALNTPLQIQAPTERVFDKAPDFSEYVRRYLMERYGRDVCYRGGLKVFTTVDVAMQRMAEGALSKGLRELDKREGYRGPLRHLSELPAEANAGEGDAEKLKVPHRPGDVVEAVVEAVHDEKDQVSVRLAKEELGRLPLSEMKWARPPNPDVAYFAASVKKPSEVLKVGDVILVRLVDKGVAPFAWEVALEQDPQVQGAIICMEPETGKVRVMVGGRDFTDSQFNRAVQSRRQPGSAFKPIIYAAALDWGMSPRTLILDAPYVSERNPDDEAWKPKNYSEKFFGPTLLRTALAESRNVVTVKILKEIGIDYAIGYARKMGIESHLSADLSLALGSSGVSLLEITRAYAVFANGGQLVKPLFVERVLDRNGEVLEEHQPEGEPVLSKETCYVMTDLLQAVVQEGTGWRVKALKRPAAGKTGTTNDLRDAWFMGYTPGLATGVWVGYDDQTPMGKGETGSRAASPIWLNFMSQALEGRPLLDFPVPEGIVFAKIDATTGLLAGPDSEKTVFQSFKEGSEPKEHSPRPRAATSGNFMQFDMAHER